MDVNGAGIALWQIVRLAEATGAVKSGRTAIKIPALLAEPQLPDVTTLRK